MSNSIAPGSSADVNVKVTALTTNQNVPVTYKTIILKKNLVNGVNTITQETMSAANTKYIIKYDYVLGEDITIPENCILEFDGGSLSGEHTITGNNTGIKAGSVKIFDTNIEFDGTFCCNVDIDWFGIVYNTETDNSSKLNKALILASLSNNKELKFKSSSVIYTKGHYDESVLADAYLTKGHVNIPSNTVLDLNNSTLKCLPNDKAQYNILFSKDTNNICIKNGIIEGERNNHGGNVGEWGYGISLLGVHGFSIYNVKCINCWGDGINTQYSNHYGDGDPTSETTIESHCIDGTIKDCECSNNRRAGMSLEANINMFISSCIFSNNGGTPTESGIDIEPVNEYNVCYNVQIDNCYIIKNKTYGILFAGHSFNINKISISNTAFDDSRNTWSVCIRNSKNIDITNIKTVDSSYFARFYAKEDCANVTISESSFSHINNDSSGKVTFYNCKVETDITNTKSIWGENLVSIGGNATCSFYKCWFKMNSDDSDQNFIIKAQSNGNEFKYCYFEGNRSKLSICGLTILNSVLYKIALILDPFTKNVSSIMKDNELTLVGGSDYIINIPNNSIDAFSATIDLSRCKIQPYGQSLSTYLIKKDSITPNVINLSVSDVNLNSVLYAFDNGINIQLGSSVMKCNTYTVSRNSFTPNISYKGTCLLESKPIWWNGTAWLDATGTQV